MHYWAKAFVLNVCLTHVVIRITAQLLPTAAKEFCHQVPDAGPCSSPQIRWYYDVPADNCTVFTYGGCLGNQNNFDSLERCDQVCRRSRNSVGYMFATGFGLRSLDDRSRTPSNVLALGVDGGRGNTNVLLAASMNDCDQHVQRGFCSSFIPRWHHNGTSCELFYYSGCGGNGNNFITRESCQDRCQLRIQELPTNLVVRQTCQLRPQRGACRSAIIRWYFDHDSHSCMEFVYSGCGGNENNYASRKECQQRCASDVSVRQFGAARSIGDPFSSPISNGVFPSFELEQGPDQAADAAPVRPSEVMLRNNHGAGDPTTIPANCIGEPDRGPCTIDLARYYYDKNTRTCRPFYYGGCLGNANRHSTKASCETSCPVVLESSNNLELCLLEPATGSCRAAFSRYYFDVSAGQCKQFTYGGCNGNANNFLTEEECERKCSSVRTVPRIAPPSNGGLLPTTGVRSLRPARCNQLSETGPCRAALSKWFFNGRSCERFVYGGCDGNDNKFDSPEECQTVCGGQPVPTISGGRIEFNRELPISQAGSSNICLMTPDSGPCDAVVPRYFNDPAADTCKPFTYGGCGGNLNNFRNSAECDLSCRSRPVLGGSANDSLPAICTYPAERGQCQAFIPAFFHDIRDGKCKMFYFGGCAGNENRFNSRQECDAVCNVGRLQTVESPPPESDPGVSISSLCNQPADSGSCLATIPAYFYDAEMSECRQFIYGGCGGNNNRFGTLEECDRRCRPAPMTRSAGPSALASSDRARKNPDCLLPTETGHCRGRFLVFGFDPNRQDCVEFTYGGCNGNGNRFRTRGECLQECGGLIASDNTNMMRLQQLNNAQPPTLIFQQERRRSML